MESKKSKGGRKLKKVSTAASSFVNTIAKKLTPKKKKETGIDSSPSKRRLVNVFSKKSKSVISQASSKPAKGKSIIKDQAATTSRKKKGAAPEPKAKKAAAAKPVLFVSTVHHRTAGATTRPTTHKPPSHAQNYTVERVSISTRMIPQRLNLLNQSKLSTTEDETNVSVSEHSKSNIQVISSEDTKNVIEFVQSSSNQNEKKESNEVATVDKDKLTAKESLPAPEYLVKHEDMLPGKSENATNEADERTTLDNSQVNLAHELVKHVDTLKKISLIADELNQKTAKGLKEIVSSVKGDLMQKLEEINLENQAAGSRQSGAIVTPMNEEIVAVAPKKAKGQLSK